jgi:hypothetical protein
VSVRPDGGQEGVRCVGMVGWGRSGRGDKEVHTTVTRLVPLDAKRLFTSARILVAVSACALRNPSCTRTLEETPGKSFVSRGSVRMLASVRMETLHSTRVTAGGGKQTQGLTVWWGRYPRGRRRPCSERASTRRSLWIDQWRG